METKIDYWLWNSVISNTDCQKIIDRGLEQLNLLQKDGFNSNATTFGENHKSDNRNISQKDLTQQQLKEKNINENDVYIKKKMENSYTMDYLSDQMHISSLSYNLLSM